MKRRDCSGAFLQIVGQQKLVKSLEGVNKMGSPEFIRHARCFQNALQLGATHPHAPGARMTQKRSKYNLREFVLTTVILAPGACGWVARNDGCGSLPRAPRDLVNFGKCVPGTSIFNNPYSKYAQFCCRKSAYFDSKSLQPPWVAQAIARPSPGRPQAAPGRSPGAPRAPPGRPRAPPGRPPPAAPHPPHRPPSRLPAAPNIFTNSRSTAQRRD